VVNAQNICECVCVCLYFVFITSQLKTESYFCQRFDKKLLNFTQGNLRIYLAIIIYEIFVDTIF